MIFNYNKLDNCIIERELDLIRIQNDVIDVNETFKYLACIVNNQQYLLDNIEDNVQHSEINLTHTVQELGKANKYQQSKGACMKYSLLCLLCIVGVVCSLTVYCNFIVILH